MGCVSMKKVKFAWSICGSEVSPRLGRAQMSSWLRRVDHLASQGVSRRGFESVVVYESNAPISRGTMSLLSGTIHTAQYKPQTSSSRFTSVPVRELVLVKWRIRELEPHASLGVSARNGAHNGSIVRGGAVNESILPDHRALHVGVLRRENAPLVRLPAPSTVAVNGNSLHSMHVPSFVRWSFSLGPLRQYAGSVNPYARGAKGRGVRTRNSSAQKILRFGFLTCIPRLVSTISSSMTTVGVPFSHSAAMAPHLQLLSELVDGWKVDDGQALAVYFEEAARQRRSSAWADGVGHGPRG